MAAMTEREKRHYLQLLSECYQQTGEVEEWEGKYELILRWWDGSVWQIQVIDRRTGEITSHQEEDYRPIAELRTKRPGYPGRF